MYCSAVDLGDQAPLSSVKVNQWNEYKANQRIYYARPVHVRSLFDLILKSNRESIIYINGIFSWSFNIAPQIISRLVGRSLVVAPRGMLQKGALRVNPLRKSLFLRFARWFHLYRHVRWHATDSQEAQDIRNIFPNSEVIIAPNVPEAPRDLEVMDSNKGDKLRLCYFSLITQKKALHLALEALRLIDQPVQLHIYGPIKDLEYWDRCQKLMAGQIHEIKYEGPLKPEQVHKTLLEYHAMVLPTQGENFGHAIYESLNSGTPVIVSAHTPWGSLQAHRAGLTVSGDSSQAWAEAIKFFMDMDSSAHLQLRKGANDLARQYYRRYDFRGIYAELFDVLTP
ncbi:MAG TPA: glycosyltransferase [Cyclobacteriaceae bacterium]|nr:glycosyltransferase [Cyclobacteriaceae bacterium]